MAFKNSRCSLSSQPTVGSMPGSDICHSGSTLRLILCGSRLTTNLNAEHSKAGLQVHNKCTAGIVQVIVASVNALSASEGSKQLSSTVERPRDDGCM
jgi:hypothetical protein